MTILSGNRNGSLILSVCI